MSIYGITKNEFTNSQQRIGNNPYLLELDNDEKIDINYEKDFNFANKIAKLNCIEENYVFNNLKNKLNSCMIADILNELGYTNCVLNNFKLNMSNNKLFGRVRPIQIRKLKESEDSNNIYNCLHSYNSVLPGNIIFVNNQIDNKAYFGDLNATISLIKQAQGTIVNGYTRDITRTIDLQYPVFYKNNTCNDVKLYGTLDYYDKPIIINNIKIYVNNLIFADIDGVIIIPKEIEEIVINKCKNIIENESNISNSIITGTPVNTIIEKYGTF
jgi:regulator of RNase E activity RraA